MRSRLGAIGIIALLTLLPSTVTADVIVKPCIGAAIAAKHGFVDLEQTSNASKLVVGAALGWQPHALGVEVEWSVLPEFFKGPNGLIATGRVTTVMGNVTWQLPRPAESSRLRAYIAGGAGLVSVRLKDALGAFSSDTSLAGGNAGGGMLIRLRPRLDVHTDVRYFKTQFGDTDRAGFSDQFISFTRITGGIVFRY